MSTGVYLALFFLWSFFFHGAMLWLYGLQIAQCASQSVEIVQKAIDTSKGLLLFKPLIRYIRQQMQKPKAE
jgi:hypothetical protein